MTQQSPADLHWVIDDVIPHTRALTRLMGDVVVMPGRDITAECLADVDILLVRSITPVTETLLDGSAVRFVGTATAGVDHLDRDFLNQKGIAWAAARGSNAVSVVEYVLGAIAQTGWLRAVLEGAPVGLVGLGEVGARLSNRLQAMGARVFAYDPYLERWPPGVIRADLETVLRQPVVSLHASLHDLEPYASRKIIDIAQVEIMLSALTLRSIGGLFINAGRGGLMSEDALEALLDSAWGVVLDTWPGEPVMPASVLTQCDWLSPHIAGHSLQARARGSDMLAAAIETWSGCDTAVDLLAEESARRSPTVVDAVQVSASTDAITWASAFLVAQSVLAREDSRIRGSGANVLTAADFDALRKSYLQPDEWTGRAVSLPGSSPAIATIARGLGLSLVD